MTINIGCPGGHIPISTPEDVKKFLSETNDMHDAYLLSADYRAHVRANHHTVVLSTEGESLVLRYQATSMLDLPIVELTFLNVAEWKVPNGELFGSMVSFAPLSSPFMRGAIPPKMSPLLSKQEKCIGASLTVPIFSEAVPRVPCGM